MDNELNVQEDEKTTPRDIIIGLVLSIGSFYAYFSGYVIAIKNLSLGKYSFLIVGILFVIFTIISVFNFFKKK